VIDLPTTSTRPSSALSVATSSEFLAVDVGPFVGLNGTPRRRLRLRYHCPKPTQWKPDYESSSNANQGSPLLIRIASGRSSASSFRCARECFVNGARANDSAAEREMPRHTATRRQLGRLEFTGIPTIRCSAAGTPRHRDIYHRDAAATRHG
jgi:hypothetical protein